MLALVFHCLVSSCLVRSSRASSCLDGGRCVVQRHIVALVYTFRDDAHTNSGNAGRHSTYQAESQDLAGIGATPIDRVWAILGPSSTTIRHTCSGIGQSWTDSGQTLGSGRPNYGGNSASIDQIWPGWTSACRCVANSGRDQLKLGQFRRKSSKLGRASANFGRNRRRWCGFSRAWAELVPVWTASGRVQPNLAQSRSNLGRNLLIGLGPNFAIFAPKSVKAWQVSGEFGRYWTCMGLFLTSAACSPGGGTMGTVIEQRGLVSSCSLCVCVQAMHGTRRM